VHTPKRLRTDSRSLIGHLGEVVSRAEESSLRRENHSRGVTLAGIEERLSEFFHQREGEDIQAFGVIQPNRDGVALALTEK